MKQSVSKKNNIKQSNHICNNYTIANDGTGYVSQREVARLLGLSSSGTISKHIKKFGSAYILNDINQLSEDSLLLVSSHYASSGNKQAIDLLQKFAKAGVRLFLYNMAKNESYSAKNNKEIPALPNNLIKKFKSFEKCQKDLSCKIELLEKTIESQNINSLLKKEDYLHWLMYGWIKQKPNNNGWEITKQGSFFLKKSDFNIIEEFDNEY